MTIDPMERMSIEETLLKFGLSYSDIKELGNYPQIIRTVEELEALDQASLIYYPGLNAGYELAYDIYAADLPAVVVATGAQVRAAHTALQEATE